MRVKSWLRRNKTSRTTTAYTNAETIGVVFTIHDESLLPSYDSFINKLEQDNKKVTVLAYYPHKLEQYNHKYECFTPQNITFWGAYKKNEIASFVNQSFDYLFQLDDDPSCVIKGILAQSNAKCRIGKYANSNDDYYEFMINTQDKDSLEQMYNYTSILN
jgi:hypothetical protein